MTQSFILSSIMYCIQLFVLYLYTSGSAASRQTWDLYISHRTYANWCLMPQFTSSGSQQKDHDQRTPCSSVWKFNCMLSRKTFSLQDCLFCHLKRLAQLLTPYVLHGIRSLSRSGMLSVRYQCLHFQVLLHFLNAQFILKH